ncbi:MAG TPA: two-component regulator propeller domain-containing protein [Panacibacter sp.]|nr:two-component regulator propeller domain-containing protein [Panacibacter sp.]
MKKLLTHTIVLLFFALSSLGQPVTSPIHFTNYTIADGLPANHINYLMQDSRGFIWMSTSQGLARFDGHYFKVYSHSRKDSSNMPSENVGNCVELNNHELLFLSGNRLWMLNPYNHRQHAPPAFWSNKNSATPCLMNKNLIAIWDYNKIYFTDMRLHVLDSVNNPFGLKDIEVVYLGNDKVLFSDDHKTFAYSLKYKKTEEWKIPIDSFKLEKYYAIKQADTLNEIIYIACYMDGIYKMSYDADDPKYLQPLKLPNGPIDGTKNVISSEGNLIVSGYGGLSVQQPVQPEIIAKNIPGDNSSILPGELWDIYTDINDNYWVSGTNGISRFNLQQLHYQFWKLPYPALISQYKKYQNKIWMSTEFRGSLSVDVKASQLQVIDSNIISYCWGASPVNGSIYIYGNSIPSFKTKLIVYNPQTKKISAPTFLAPFYHNAELITMVYQSRNGDVWYSMNFGNGLVRQKAGSNEFTQYRSTDNPKPFTFSYVHNVAEDKNGNIYFTSNKKNIVLVWKNKPAHFEEWEMDSLLNRKDIHFGPLLYHIIDSKQNLWLSYQQIGLVKYNLVTHKGKLYETEDGLPANIINNIVADADDNIWIASEKGLTCLLSSTDKFVTFTEKNGLPFNNFLESHLFYDKDDSSLYFSKTGYLYKLKNYELLKQKKQSNAKLFIDGMDVNNQPFYFDNDKNIQLKPGENNLQFGFTLLDADNKISNKKYEYRLVRNNEKAAWQKIDGNIIAFTRLTPGDYTLQARLQDEANNTYIESNNTFHFTIATEWYNTTWFIALCFATGIFIAWSFIRVYYQRKLEKQKALLEKEKALEAERSRIAADMHDDVGAGLSRIRYIVSAIKEGKSLNNADMDKIMNLSDESVEKMNEIIWSLNHGNRNLDELIYHIRSQCATVVSNANLEFVCELPAAIPSLNMEWNESRNIYMLVKEAVNNAVKHAAANMITLDFSFQNEFTITVVDNGKGYNAASANKEGNGLKNYEKRTAALNATFSIETVSGIGTKVMFRFILPPQQHT